MPNLNREMLRQMIAEEIAKTENTEPEAVKVSADQLRNIIMNEVRIISEQDDNSEKFSIQGIEYAVDMDNVYVVKDGKRMVLDPSKPKAAIAIRNIKRAARNNPDLKELLDDDTLALSAAVKVADSTAGGKPKSEAMKMLAQAVNSAVEKPSLEAFKVVFDVLKNPKFKVDELPPEQRNIAKALEDAGHNDLADLEIDDLLPKMRKLQVDIKGLFK